jgi:hypothetical protein
MDSPKSLSKGGLFKFFPFFSTTFSLGRQDKGLFF